ncbi:unnamed protein product [Adineta steineri]|uniref:Endonuclease/exonuclease/phosphatase domain-containing protein n=3 Tax=Adineta steineri TaxID=433720 RepID=A0A814K3D5_9BILA|nr:unnamed protein product [Adineta steineri]
MFTEERMFDLSLISWNILAPCWVNKDWYPSLYELAIDSKTRSNIILSKISSMNCDIIIIQEAQQDFICLCKEKFHNNYIYEFAPNNPTMSSISNGLLTLINKNWKYAKEINIINEILDNERGEAIQIISIHSKNIHLINLHLDYIHSISQANKIKEKCKQFLNISSSISIIGGDLNATKDIYDQFQWIGYNDIFNESIKDKIIPTYYPDSSQKNSNSSIDHIFYDPKQVTLIDCGKAWDVQNRSAEETLRMFGSDHIYIWANFCFI